MFWGRFYKFSEKDRIYVSLPLYHSAGAVLGMCVAWSWGATVILARKFSATHFWEDCRRNNVTVIQYIGEICRYLLNAPEHPLDKAHSIRLAHGNGMRPDVWNRFRDRFGIPLIGEWYASTEGTGALSNYNTGVAGSGAIGHRGALASLLDKGLKIAKFDVQTEELIRGKNGYCIEVYFIDLLMLFLYAFQPLRNVSLTMCVSFKYECNYFSARPVNLASCSL